MRKASSYLTAMLCGCLIALAAWCALFYSQLGLPTTHSYWTSALVTQKLAAARNASGNKIVVIAGSSGNFNVDAELISRKLGISTVNLGTHAILPLGYMLDHARPILHRGDTVILALEYLYFASDERLSEAYLDYLISRDPEYFRSRGLREKVEIIGHVSLKRLLTAKKESWQPRGSPYPFNVYTDFFYSPFGDTHANNLVFLNETMRNGRAGALVEHRIPTISDKQINWSLLADFVAWCKTQGVKIIAVPPATMKFDVYQDPKFRRGIEAVRRLYSDRGVPFIGDPYDAMLERDLFFDTNYHANQLGKRKYTELLLHWLDGELPPMRTDGKFQETSVDSPVDEVLRHFNGWMPIAGLRTFEGPYPERQLNAVAWGSPQLRLQVDMDRDDQRLLTLDAAPISNGQPLHILVNDREIYAGHLANADEFSRIAVVLPLKSGQNTITIRTSSASTSETGISALFRELLLSPSPAKENHRRAELPQNRAS
ncbi:hypothetical protein SAMN05216345_105405 [Cupriavidus sp. YR651]|uniref:hypothetical protein n=1 Tax=Cupriavidus sp. YR651 TaxID=1855315 RepID=UPI00088CEC5D|nr:hypothetical protein [Cupriavidus sp. YR651]SDD05824.1 hypothetical protein SAMN05216345_105405 [Cupriavidus sp. YR651]